MGMASFIICVGTIALGVVTVKLTKLKNHMNIFVSGICFEKM